MRFTNKTLRLFNKAITKLNIEVYSKPRMRVCFFPKNFCIKHKDYINLLFTRYPLPYVSNEVELPTLLWRGEFNSDSQMKEEHDLLYKLFRQFGLTDFFNEDHLVNIHRFYNLKAPYISDDIYPCLLKHYNKFYNYNQQSIFLRFVISFAIYEALYNYVRRPEFKTAQLIPSTNYYDLKLIFQDVEFVCSINELLLANPKFKLVFILSIKLHELNDGSFIFLPLKRWTKNS